MRDYRDYQIPMAQAGMKIGLLGGSFNPPHEGHRHISLVALKHFQLDRVWWIVSPGNPLKSQKDLLPLQQRLALCKSVADHPRIDITGFEAGRTSAYTYDTLSYLTRRSPKTRFLWLMGADNLKTFHLWRNWRSIFELMPIAIIDRPFCRYAALASEAAHSFHPLFVPENRSSSLLFHKKPHWTFLTAPLNFQSSTQIRQRSHLFKR